jgi:hypothetical protein
VPTLPRAAQLLDQNAELAARLKVAEESLRQIKQAHEQLQTEHRHTLESKMLLEEEVRFLKNYIYGRSSEKLLRTPARDGHDSEMMADTIPAA